MKKFLVFAILSCLLFSVSANDNALLARDNERQALYAAIDDAFSRLNKFAFGQKSISILPMKNQYDILRSRIQSGFVKAGLVCVEGKTDPLWDEILKEIEWDERKDDILDPATIAKFGKLKATQVLIQCLKPVVSVNADRIYAQIELRAIEIATKQVIWTETGVARFAIGKDVIGIMQLDQDVRRLLQKHIAREQSRLQSPAFAGKFNRIKTVAVIPLCGDIDNYITRLTLSMLTTTNLIPLNSPISSLELVRSTVRDGQFKADAICYGALRAAHKTLKSTTVSGRKLIETFELVAEVQLFIEEAKTGNVLWASEPFIEPETITSERDMDAAEWEKYRAKRGDTVTVISENILENILNNWFYYLKLIVLCVAGVVVLVVLIVIAAKTIFSSNSNL